MTIDLSGAAPWTTVALLVRGDTPLASDPGSFAIVPVVIAN